MGAPWFKMYAQDYLGDPKVRMLSDADRGILVDCWAIQTAIGSIPMDPEQLGRLLSRRPDHALRAFQKVSCFFVDDPLKDGFKVSLRLLSEQQQYERKLLANQLNGAKGGRPRINPVGFHQSEVLVNPNGMELRTQNSEEDKTTPTPSATLPGLGLDLVSENKPSRKEKKKQKLSPYRDDVVAQVLDWETRWPSERQGKKIRNDVVASASLVEGILSREPELDLATLNEAVSEWLTNPGDYPNAMEFWFGPGKSGVSPPWERAVRAVLTRRKMGVK